MRFHRLQLCNSSFSAIIPLRFEGVLYLLATRSRPAPARQGSGSKRMTIHYFGHSQKRIGPPARETTVLSCAVTPVVTVACRAQAATGRCRLLVYPPLIAQYLSDFSLHSLTISADLSVLLYHMPRIKYTFAQRQPGDFILMIGGE